jgi:archaetidylinositol phosphate synthase
MYMPDNGFRSADRANHSVLASLEKKALIWMAQRMPACVNSDHLSALGFVALMGVGFSYWYSRYSNAGLVLVIVFFALNWFGDSLDGTLARVRNQQRPRYGFYVDHILDACGSVFVFGGLVLSGHMSGSVAVGLLIVYLLLSIEIYLATYTVGTFHLSFAAFGPTELRLLLVAGNIALFYKRMVVLGGNQYLLFDVGGSIGIVGMAVALAWSILKHTTHLYRAETPAKLGALQFRPKVLRWLKFNAVGVAGFAVQLAVLSLFTRVWGIHYLVATTLAVEIAVLHNFIWHEVWTWRGLAVDDRWRRLVRFHLANGFVSIASNVLLTWMVKDGLHLPLLAANAGAVGMTAILNFALASVWVFPAPEAPAEERLSAAK